MGEPNHPTLASRLSHAGRGTGTYGPTDAYRESLVLAQQEFNEVRPAVDRIVQSLLPAIEQQLKQLGVPYVEGQAMGAY